MALSDLSVFSEYAYTTMTEVLREQVDLFNTATANGIIMRAAPIAGDYKDESFFPVLSGLVRRRDPYASGAVAPIHLTNDILTSVKVAAGTPPIDISPSMWAWIKQSPEIAGATIGKQLAVAAMKDELDTAVSAGIACIGSNAALVKDVSAQPDNTIGYENLVKGMALFGDASGEIVVWVMHSKPAHDLYGRNVANSAHLFTFDTINVMRDPFGKLIVVTDNANLLNVTYRTLGLVPGGLTIADNGDFFANESTTNGTENINRTYQAEWSYNVAVKGYSWDKAAGGKAPTSAELANAANWDKKATSNKDCAGIMIIST